MKDKCEKALYDKKQLIFTAQGSLKSNEFRFAKVEEKAIDFNKKVTCPFCLSWQTLNKFLISTKEGYHKGLGHCQECNQNVQFKTLFNLGQWTPEQYAKFVVDYPPAGFFKKIKFDEWKNRLNLMKWGQRFWTEYRRLNPKIEEESHATDEGDDDQSYDREELKREFERRQQEFEENESLF